VIQESSSTTHPLIAAWDLGQGESEVLTLALEKDGACVVLDDLQARKCAALFDIPLIDDLVESQKCPRIVIPVKTGIQKF
jgi:hypothetical protein